jgi:hypothetical protein
MSEQQCYECGHHRVYVREAGDHKCSYCGQVWPPGYVYIWNQEIAEILEEI